MAKKKTAERVALARRLRTLGLFLEKDELESLDEPGLSILQDAGIPSQCFNLPSGVAGYEFNIVMVNETRDTVLSPSHIDFSGPNWDFHLRLLPEPSRRGPYVLGARDRYERKLVLNHLIGREHRVFPGQAVEGLLLAVGQDPVPSGYEEFQRFKVNLRLFDQTGRSKETLFGMVVRRSQLRQPASEPNLKRVGAVHKYRETSLVTA
jgi:hypothetical protein